MIQAILFDFTQTLADSSGAFKAAEAAFQKRLAAELGAADHDAFLEVYRSVRKACHDRTPNFSRREMWLAFYERLGRTPAAAAECEQLSCRLTQWELEYWQIVCDRTVLFPEVEAVLEALAGRYTLGLLSNKQGPGVWADHVLNRFPALRRHFAAVLVAGEGGVPAKPAREAFERCLAAMSAASCEREERSEFRDLRIRNPLPPIPPSAAVYVGDDWRVDICGARDAGLTPIWLKHRLVSRHWPAVTDPATVIETLEPLVDIDGLLRRQP